MRIHRDVALAGTLVLAVVGGCAPDVADLPQPLEGKVIEVRREGADIAGFTVSGDDVEEEILIDREHDYGFDLNHLEEHRRTGDPVRVRWAQRGDRAYAVTIEDA
ncbi:MAG TPA: hypothetical protein VM638_01645 [Actinomycetota bacterium]|nr:hypothetical protein [Actinomycetota bacterium]